MVRRTRFMDKPLPGIYSYQNMENFVDYKGSSLEHLSQHIEDIRAEYFEKVFRDKTRLAYKPAWEMEMRRLRCYQQIMREKEKAKTQRGKVKLEKIHRKEEKTDKKVKKHKKKETEEEKYDYPNLRWIDGITTEKKARDGQGILREVFPHVERMLEESKRNRLEPLHRETHRKKKR